jgi:ATP-dependent Lon protease
MTGSLGDVISESADLALAVVRSRAATELPSGLNLNRLHEVDIHVSPAFHDSTTPADILIQATSSLGCGEERWT